MRQPSETIAAMVWTTILLSACICNASETLCGTEPATMTLLIPNEETRHIDPLGATVSVDRGLRITFSKPNSGARISAPLGAWNLENYAAVAIDIRHLGSKAVALVGEIDQRSWTNSFLHIDVGKTETIVIILQRQELNDQRAEQFVGMRGVPGGHVWHWEGRHPDMVKAITLRDLDGVSVGQTIEILAIRAIGAYGPIPQETNAYFPFVDRFGQFKHGDWQGKVKGSSDLVKFARREKDDLAANPGSNNRSQYGGWLDGPRLRSTGHFRTTKHKGQWWLVDPDGYLFWSHGIDCVRFEAQTTVRGRTHYFEALPEGLHSGNTVDFAQANQRTKYGPEWTETVMDLAHRRLKSWGMNTTGNWSDPNTYRAGRTPYVVAVHYGWNKDDLAELIKQPEKLSKSLRKRLTQEVGITTDDPWCIGYFVDNELRWRKGMDPNVYYRVVSEEVRRVAPNKLYLGSRLHGHAHAHGSPPHIVAAAAKYCDVIGINRYRFSPTDLRMLAGVDKPLLIGEFHFGALDRGMLHPGLRSVANQNQRARAYEHYVTQALKHPHIVGTHWFQYREQSVTGRSDGENYQIGFVDICDTPYREIIDASRRIGKSMYRLRSGTSDQSPKRPESL